MDETSPILSTVQQYAWDGQGAVSYEVAVEAIGEVVACYTVLIQQAQLVGDTDRVRELDAAKNACIGEREQLRSTDHAVVDRALREYPQLVTGLRGQMS